MSIYNHVRNVQYVLFFIEYTVPIYASRKVNFVTRVLLSNKTFITNTPPQVVLSTKPFKIDHILYFRSDLKHYLLSIYLAPFTLNYFS